MSELLKLYSLDQLSMEDQLEVADALLESIKREEEKFELTPAQRDELELRFADSIARPEAVTAWETIKARLLSKEIGQNTNNS